MKKIITHKRCPMCGEIKEVSCFNHNKARSNGISTYCTICTRFYINKNSWKYKAVHHEYYLTHIDEIKLNQRIYRENNRQTLIEYDRKRYAEHPEYKKSFARKRRTEKREEVNRSNRKYYATHPNYAAQATNRWRKRQAILRGASGNGITTEQWEKLKSEYNYCCAYCGDKKPLTQDHIIPLARGGIHDVSNIIPACKSCNSSKRDLMPSDWDALLHLKM